jgi:hypothetical protein
MKIRGHKTDSLERRYNIVDADDLSIAKEFVKRRMKAAQLSRKRNGLVKCHNTRPYNDINGISDLDFHDTR